MYTQDQTELMHVSPPGIRRVSVLTQTATRAVRTTL